VSSNSTEFETRLDQQEQRLERMASEQATERRRSRRWKRVGLTGWLACGAIVLMGQDGGDVQEQVSAQRFVVRDNHGTARGLLACNDSGVPSLSLLAPDGETVRATLGLTSSGEGSSIVMKDSNGENRLTFTVTNGGVPSIALTDTEGRNRISLGVADNGVTFLAMRSENGRIRNMLYLNPDGSGHLRFKDEDNNTIQELP
jgi:hypothetical protein